ncbi:hypothetical protein [Brachyspira sp. SAP_772]|nr:hypothetical protein [Brachyspira sp. SAP_772]
MRVGTILSFMMFVTALLLPFMIKKVVKMPMIICIVTIAIIFNAFYFV